MFLRQLHICAIQTFYPGQLYIITAQTKKKIKINNEIIENR